MADKEIQTEFEKVKSFQPLSKNDKIEDNTKMFISDKEEMVYINFDRLVGDVHLSYDQAHKIGIALIFKAEQIGKRISKKSKEKKDG